MDGLPEIDLRHLRRMTDDTGMYQHAVHHVPDANHGYCIDDNCRALIVALLYEHLFDDGACAEAVDEYLAFVVNALNGDGRFRNFMSYDRQWLEDVGSDDSHCRAMWSLGMATRIGPTQRVRELSAMIFERGLAACERFDWVHPMAYTLIALDERLGADSGYEGADHAESARQEIGARFFLRYQANAGDDWPWWTDRLTWGNAKLPHALLVTGRALGDSAMVDAALTSLRWSLDEQLADGGHFSPVGNDGWYERDGKRARFDQQAIEAQGYVQACLAAARTTGDLRWAEDAYTCFEWFTGRNDLGISLYDDETGGVFDGLHPDRANRNQGAESVLAYLISGLELHAAAG